MRGNTVTIVMSDKRGKMAKTIPLYQFDYGQRLIIENVDLPTGYEVHFSNELHGEAITMLGDATGVDIPNQLLETGLSIYLWLFLHDGVTDGETEYAGVIPVIKRAEITDIEPTPHQADVIEQTINALNNSIGASEAARAGAEDAQAAAEAAQAAAENAQSAAEVAQENAESAQDNAETANTNAQTAQGLAEDAQEAAEAAKLGAETAAANALIAQTAAETAAENSNKVVIVSDTQPQDEPYNKLWIKDQAEQEYTVPLYSEFTELAEEVGDKLDKPVTPGTSGQVLTSDGQGGQSWQDASGGDPTEIIDDTAGAGDTDKTWSADKLVSDLKNQITNGTIEENLLRSELPGTTVAVTFDSNDNPSTITHSKNNVTIRTDVFTWGTDSVTEVRTLASGKKITIVTNLVTLAQTISDVEEVA